MVEFLLSRGLLRIADVGVLEQGLWIAVAAVLAFWSLRALQSSPEFRREVVLLGLLTAAALSLRVALALHGPGDYKVTLLDYYYDGVTDYGYAPSALLRLLDAFLPDDKLLLWPNLVLGALAPALLVALARELDIDRRVAWTAGVLLVLHPLALRFSGAENRTMYVLFLEPVAFLGLVRYWKRGEWSALLAAAAGALLALDTRPEAVRVLPEMALLLAGLALFARRPSTPLLSWRLVGAGLVLIVLVAGVLLSESAVGHVNEVVGLRNYFSPDVNIWLDPTYTPWPFVLLLLAGLPFAWLDRRHRVLLWAVGALVVSALTASAHPTAENLASTRYQMNALLFWSLLAGLGTVRVWDLLGRKGAGIGAIPRALLILLAGAATLGTIRSVVAPRTIDFEYTFLREAVRQLPEDAEIYRMPFIHGDAHLTRMEFLSLVFRKENQRWLSYPPTAPYSGHPRYYVHCAACAVTADSRGEIDAPRIAIREGCAAARARYAANAILEKRVPARRYSDDRYEAEEVLLGVYRIPDDERLPLARPHAPPWVTR